MPPGKMPQADLTRLWEEVQRFTGDQREEAKHLPLGGDTRRSQHPLGPRWMSRAGCTSSLLSSLVPGWGTLTAPSLSLSGDTHLRFTETLPGQVSSRLIGSKSQRDTPGQERPSATHFCG